MNHELFSRVPPGTYEVLADCFQATMNSDRSIRVAAEDALKDFALRDQGFLVYLLCFSVTPSSAANHGESQHQMLPEDFVKQAAAIRFRNMICHSDWKKNELITEEVRTAVVCGIVPLMCQPHVKHLIAKQLTSAFQSIVEYDWVSTKKEGSKKNKKASASTLPVSSRWQQQAVQQMLEVLNQSAQSQQLTTMRTALTALRSCCKLYEDVLRFSAAEIDEFCSQHIPTLLDVFDYLNTASSVCFQELSLRGGVTGTAFNGFDIDPSSALVDDCTRLVLKSIWSLTASRMPFVFCEDNGNFVKFLGQLLAVWEQGENVFSMLAQVFFVRNVTQFNNYQPLRQQHVHQELLSSAFFKKMKWVAAFSHRLIRDFVLLKEVEPRARPVAAMFLEQQAPLLAEKALNSIRYHHNQTLPNLPNSQPAVNMLSTKHLIFCLEFLNVCSGSEQLYWQIIHPIAGDLLTELLLPRLGFSSEDEELWMFNPEEYVRKQNDPRDDLYNPKLVSMSLIVQLVIPSKSFHDNTLLGSLLGHIVNLLERFGSVATNEAFTIVDGCLFAIGQLKKAMLPGQSIVDNASLENVLVKYVAPHLANTQKGFLRARAVATLAQFTQHVEWSSVEVYRQLVEGVLCLLRDEELPVRIQACVCVGHFIRHPMAVESVGPRIAIVIQEYFNIMRQIDNAGVVRTLRKTIKYYGATVSQWAVEMCQNLIGQFDIMRHTIRQEQERTDALGDDEGDALADTALAADELLAALATIVKSMPPRNAEANLALQEVLAPMFCAILGNVQDSQGFMDGTLTLLTKLTAKATNIASGIWDIYPMLYDAVVNFGATDYFSAILAPLDNLISVDAFGWTERELYLPDGGSVTYCAMLHTMCEKVLADSNLRSREMAAVPEVIDSVMLNLYGARDKVNEAVGRRVISDLVVLSLKSLSGATRAKKMPPTLLLMFANNALTGMIASAATVLEVLVQSNATTHFFSSYVSLALSLQKLLRPYDRRVFVLALASIFSSVQYSSIPAEAVFEVISSLFQTNLLPAFCQDDVRLWEIEGQKMEKVKAKGFEALNSDGEESDMADESDTDDDTDDDPDGLWEGAMEDDFEDEEIENDAQFASVLQQAANMREKLEHDSDADSESESDDLEENLLVDNSDVVTPIENLNHWQLLGESIVSCGSISVPNREEVLESLLFASTAFNSISRQRAEFREWHQQSAQQ